MRTPSRRPARSWFRPRVLILEERLPLGEGVLGLLVGAALLPADAVFAAVTEPSGERGVSTPRSEAVATGGFTPPARQGEVFADVFTEGHDSASAWAAPRASAPRQRDALLTSPQRQQGVGPQPLLAPRAGEGSFTPRAVTLLPTPTVTAPRTDDELLLFLTALRQPAPAASDVAPAQEARVKESFGQLPLYFEENVGQTDASVQFFARGPGYGLFLTSTEAVMVLRVAGSASDRTSEAPPRPVAGAPGYEPATPPAVVRMQLVGANAAPTVTGRNELPGKVNYFLGNDPAQWHTNIATFGRVEYDDVYPGIDLVWHGSQRQLEYDFVVAPGADPGVIRLHVSGAARLEIDPAGDLLIHAGEPGGVSPGSTLRQHKPFVYQDVNGGRREVTSRFVLEGQQVRFAVAAYDAGRPLVIDPVLSYSTYFGGTGLVDVSEAIAVDPATGDALLAGYTASTDFPTANAFQPNFGGGSCFGNPCNDAFVARLRADGQALVYSTYLGGSNRDEALGLAVDPASGDALLTGRTQSSNFPTANPLQPSLGGGICFGGQPCFDAFAARLRGDGQNLVYSTYLGGSNWDEAYGLTVDSASGDALVTGTTYSPNFPTANAFQPNHGGLLCGFPPSPCSDAFVTRLRADGQALVYSTYLGGSNRDEGHGLAVDPASGDALVTGLTYSTNFPTANPFQPTNRGQSDAFVARLRPNGSALVYSTYLGGGSLEGGRDLAVDPATGDALVTGSTLSFDFPTANPLQTTLRGPGDAYVTRLRADGAALVYSTYLGGSSRDVGYALAADPATGDALVTGWTLSSDFPTANPLQATNRGNEDVFVTRLNATGSALVYATYLGGSGFDRAQGLAVDPATGDALLTGSTSSTDFPTANPLQPALRGNGDAFVTRIGSSPAAYYYVYPDSGQVLAGVPFDVYVFALDAGFNLIPDYRGEILFYATDPQATTPVYHQFQRAERGIAYFPGGLTFNTVGFQELYVFDWPGIQVFGYAAFDVRP